MPIIVPKDIPASKILQAENIFVMNSKRAAGYKTAGNCRGQPDADKNHYGNATYASFVQLSATSQHNAGINRKLCGQKYARRTSSKVLQVF